MTTPVAQLAPGTIIETPEVEAEHFGIPVCYLGEDGDMLALGHHTARRALAAFNRHARRYCGLANVADDRDASAAAWLADVKQIWLVFTTPDPDEGDDPGFIWVSHQVNESTPGAQPVTYLPAA
ncbi:hypothetical protein ABZ684_04665 [Streptomyces sp. NPDC006995]|uniref:hypothetical protein n=1 Tax=Streptomyces sp. NPDC006995 TaxID=3156907 RepID=UPI0033EB3C2B